MDKIPIGDGREFNLLVDSNLESGEDPILIENFILLPDDYPNTPFKERLRQYNNNSKGRYFVPDITNEIAFVQVSISEGVITIESLRNNSYYLDQYLNDEERVLFKGFGMKLLCSLLRKYLEEQVFDEEMGISLKAAFQVIDGEDVRNQGLIAYYSKFGFEEIEDREDGTLMETTLKNLLSHCS